MRKVFVLVVCLLAAVLSARALTLEVKELVYSIEYLPESKLLAGFYLGTLENLLGFMGEIAGETGEYYIITLLDAGKGSALVGVTYLGSSTPRSTIYLTVGRRTFQAYLFVKEWRVGRYQNAALWLIPNGLTFVEQIFSSTPFDVVLVKLEAGYTSQYLTISKEDFRMFLDAFDRWSRKLFK